MWPYESSEPRRTKRSRASAKVENSGPNWFRAQRMESLGKLAGGVAHDFNNLLTGIIGHAELLSLKAKNDTELANHSKIILDTGQRAARLTRQLLTFSRRGDQTLQLTSVNQSIENVVSILERSIDRRITVETHFTGDHDQVRADPALLESAFLNLAINARDALPEGGRIRFETDLVDPPPVIVSLMDHQSTDPYVRVRVSDNGIGIPSTDLDRVFDPYFTTKERGKGTGLGLSAVYGTIRDYGGTVNVKSRVGTGTVFTHLPARGPRNPEGFKERDQTGTRAQCSSPVRPRYRRRDARSRASAGSARGSRAYRY